jgi:hypothetical protein
MNIAIDSRNSKISALLLNKDKVFALEKTSDVFEAVLRASKSGFPRALLTAAKSTLDEAVANGEALSPRSAELRTMVNDSLRVPALFRAKLH